MADITLKEINKKLSKLISMVGVDKQWLNTSETSHYIGYSEDSIYTMVKRGEFVQGVHYHKKRKKLIFNKSELDKWVVSDNPFNNSDFNVDKTIEDILSEIA